MVSAIGKFGFGRRIRGAVLLLSSLLVASSAAQPRAAVRIDSVFLLDEYGHRQRVRPQTSIDLPARQNYLSLTLRTDRPVPVLYQLEGLDETWFRGYSTDRFHYANLPGGKYVFRVKVAGTDAETMLTLLVDAPFWKSWWFGPLVVLYVLLVFGALGYLLYRYRIRQFMRLQNIRDRIARDLHDDMGSSLSSISILSQTAARHPDQAGPTLAMIGETARQVMDSMSDIVWSVNPRHDATAMLVERMRQRADELFDGQTTEISFSTGPGVTDLTLTLEQQRDFFLIYKEALTNAARYAHARHIEISLTQAHRRLLLLNLSDDGVGFDTTAPSAQPDRTAPANRRPESGNGLTNIRTRAESLGAVLLIQSQPGRGTVIRLEMPV